MDSRRDSNLPAARGTRILHAALAGGSALVGTVVFLLVETVERPVGRVQIPDVAFASLALLQIGLAFAFLRRRIPARRFDQSIEDYWSTSQVRGASIGLWATIEGASMLSWVGYLLTGGMASASVGLLGLIVLIKLRPGRLDANEGTTAGL